MVIHIDALNLAYKKVEQRIARAKAERGRFIRRYLSEGGGRMPGW